MSSTGATYNWRTLGDALKRSGAGGESYSRVAGAQGNGAVLTLGTLFMVAFDLPGNTLITSTTWQSATTALIAGTSPHLWAVLCDSSRVVKAVTADDTSPVWGSNAEHVFTFGTAFTTTYAGLHYIGIMHMGTTATVPTLSGANVTGTAPNALAPILWGTSSTTQTTPPALAATMGAITATAILPWCYWS